MAAKVGMSHTTVGRIWRTFGLKPHVTEIVQDRGFRRVLREMEAHVEPTLDVHVVLDNLSARRSCIAGCSGIRASILHFTPTYASWLHLVERFFGMLTEKALRRGSHTSVSQLRDAIIAYVEAHNAKGQHFKWTKTADEILDKIRPFGLRTEQVHGQ